MNWLNPKSLSRLSLVAVFLLGATTSHGASGARAMNTILIVSKTTDTNDGVCDVDCSLREAILTANAQPGADNVIVPAGVYTLTIPGANEDAGATGDLDITDDLTLTGAGAQATVIDGGGIDRVLEVTGTVAIDGVAVRGGSFISSPTTTGIRSEGTLTLINSSVTNNIGGGLYSYSGALVLFNSTVASNTLEGISINYGSAVIDHSSILANGKDIPPTCCDAATGIGIYNSGMVTITNSTLADNLNENWFALYAAGHSTVYFANNLVTNNTGGLYFYDSTAVVRDSSFISNTTTDWGGAIAYQGDGYLTITHSQFISNSSTSSFPMFGGGAIWQYYSRDLIISDSVFVNNYAPNGGGAIVSSAALSRLFISNSTFSDNGTALSGGAIWGAVPMELDNVTIVGNKADSDQNGSGDGGGLYNYVGTIVKISNVLAAGNSDWGNEAPDCSGPFTSLGYNLIQDPTGCVISGTLTGVITGTDPLVGPLQDNGGNTLTHALLPGSPAIDAGNPMGCIDAFGLLLLTDQRGYARHVDGGSGLARCDIGAYEANALLVTPTPTATQTASPTPTPTPSPTGTPTSGQSYLLYLSVIRRDS